MATTQVTCAVCEVHAEAVFRVEGLDCNDEVVILERRLKPIAGVEAIAAILHPGAVPAPPDGRIERVA